MYTRTLIEYPAKSKTVTFICKVICKISATSSQKFLRNKNGVVVHVHSKVTPGCDKRLIHAAKGTYKILAQSVL